MTKEEIAYKETLGIFDEHELGITGLANAMDIFAKQQCIEFLKWKESEEGQAAINIYRYKLVSNPDESEIYELFIQSQSKG